MPSFKDVRDMLLICYSMNILKDDEFLLLYDLYSSQNLNLPYDTYPDFDLEEMEEDECLAEFRFKKGDIPLLAQALRIPSVIRCNQGSICDGIDGLCMLLKRLSYPCRYSDMVHLFAKPVPVISMITNKVLDYMYDMHNHRIIQWNQTLLSPVKLEQYANAVARKGAPLDNCFGFVDGTVRPISRPLHHQRILYNGHKRVHAIKFQSLVIPNGIIANMYGPVEGRKHDAAMLVDSRLLHNLNQFAHSTIGQPLCIYGDPAYPLRIHLQSPFRNAILTPQMEAYNAAMSSDHTCNPVHKNLAVICPNKCGEKVKKDEISNHVSQHCALTFVPCVYHRFGCNVKTPRKDMNKHMEKSIGHHFNITCERLLSLEDENRKLNDKQKEVEQQVHNFKDSLMKERKEQRSAVKELTDIKTKVEQHSVKLDKALQSLNNQKSEFTKEIRTLKQQRGQQQVDEDAKNRNDVKIIGEKLDEKISSCYVYMETSVDQLHRDFENKAVKLTNLLRKDLISFYFLMIVLFWCTFASKSDTIETRLTELVQDIKHVNARLSHKFIFNIENFNDMLRRAKKTGGDYVHRQAFYNKKYGYKFKVIVYPNGYGEGKDTHVSLHIQMIRGKYDAILPWPFTEKIKISILGQDGNISQRSIAEANIDPTKISKYFRKPITASNEPYVFDTFVSHERLALEGIFYTDSLFVKVEYESV